MHMENNPPSVYFLYGSGVNFKPGLQVICRYLAMNAGVDTKIKFYGTLAYLKRIFICIFERCSQEFDREHRSFDCLVLSDFGRKGSGWNLIYKTLCSLSLPVWQREKKLVLIELSGAEHCPFMPLYFKLLEIPRSPKYFRLRARHQLELFNRSDAVGRWDPREGLETFLRFRSSLTSKDCRAYLHCN